VVRLPKSRAVVPRDLPDAVQQLTAFLQEKPLATTALLTLALAVGAGANSIGRLPRRKPKVPAKRVPSPVHGITAPLEAVPAPARRLPRRRKGLGVAAFELDQTGTDGRRTAIDFSWTGPKRKPGVEPEPVRRESRVGVALFELFHSRPGPGGKDTAIKFGWSKEPLEPVPAQSPDGAKPVQPEKPPRPPRLSKPSRRTVPTKPARRAKPTR
jgi:hypothetical protein